MDKYETYGWICDAETGERIRPATKAEHDLFERANPGGYCMGEDVCIINGRRVGYEA